MTKARLSLDSASIGGKGVRLRVKPTKIRAVSDGLDSLHGAFRVVYHDLGDVLQVTRTDGAQELRRELEVLEEERAGLVEEGDSFLVVLLTDKQDAGQTGLAESSRRDAAG